MRCLGANIDFYDTTKVTRYYVLLDVKREACSMQNRILKKKLKLKLNTICKNLDIHI